MKRKGMKMWKRFIAMVLIISIVITDSNLWSITAMADNTENTTSGNTNDNESAIQTTLYQFNCVTTIGGEEVAVPNVQFTVCDKQKNPVLPNSEGNYLLTVGTEYSYVVSSEKLNQNITGTFTACEPEEDESVVKQNVNVEHAKLNIAMERAICKRLGTVSLFQDGDWDLGWNWTSSNSYVATVNDEGVVTGKEKGTVTITKTKKTDSAIKESTKVEVVATEVKCKLAFVIHDTVELKNINYTISNNGEEVKADEEGYYTLTEGLEYDYTITTSEGITAGETGTFTAPDKTEADFETEQIKVEVTEPVLTINGTVLEDATADVKKGSYVDVAWNNLSEVFDSENWTYTVSTKGNEVKLNEIVSDVSCSEKVTITLKYNESTIQQYTMNVFDSYTKKVVYQYGGGDYVIDDILYKVTKGEEEISYDDMSPWETYTLTISGNGINTQTIEYSPVPFVQEQIIYLAAEDFTQPVLSSEKTLEGRCGETISLADVTRSNYCESLDWQWKCVKKDDSDVSLSIVGDEIQLSEAEPGEYVLTYCFGDMESSNSLPVKVNKLSISIDWKGFEGFKYYDGTDKFKIKMNIKDNTAVVKNDGQNSYEINDKDVLVLEGTLRKTVDGKSGGVVGSYSSLIIEKVSVENENDENAGKRYDCSAISLGETVIGVKTDETTGETTGKFEVKQLVVKVSQKQGKIILDYRTNNINYNKNIENIIFSIGNLDNKEDIQKFLYKKMQDSSNPNTVYINQDGIDKVSFPGVKYNAEADPGKNFYIWDGADATTSNAVFYFANAKYDKDKGVIFDFEYTKEDIQNIDLNNFQLLQDVDGSGNTYSASVLQSGSWVNSVSITGQVLGDYLTTENKEGYDTIGFIDIGGIPDSMQDVTGTLEPTLQLNEESDSDKEKEVRYYAVMFTKKGSVEGTVDNSWPYTTGVAVVRVIPEDKRDGDYPTSVENFPYPIINLYYDETPASVKFAGGTDTISLDRDDNEETVYHTEKAEEKITFQVSNTGFDISSIQYAFVNFEDVGWTTETDGKKEISYTEVNGKFTSVSGTNLTLKEDGKYTVNCPEDGTYVLYVKVKTKGNQESTYISNAFIVDSKPPIIRATFVDEEGTAYSKDILKGKKTYVSSDTLAATFKIEDASSVDCTVEVTATDFSGNPIDTGDLASKIETGIEMSAEHTYEANLTTFGNYTITINAVDSAKNNGISELYEEEEDISNVPVGAVYQFTFDKEVPDATVRVKGNIATISTSDGKVNAVTEFINEIIEILNKVVNAVQEKIYGKDSITYVLSASDRISGCKEIGYYITEKDMSEDDLKNLDKKLWTAYEGTTEIKVSANEKQSIYQRIADNAGNISYAGMSGLITDTVAPEVLIEPAIEKNGNSFYNGDVPLKITVEDVAPAGTTACSGLQYVTYRIEAGNEVYTPDKIPYDGRDSKDSSKTSHTITGIKIDAKQFNSNEVKVYVMAADNSGNLNTDEPDYKPQVFMIDTTKPEIDITFDDQEGADYYNHTRTATITIKERNLDVNDVNITIKSEHGSKAKIGKWTHSDNAGESDDATHTCKVTFDADDDYEFYVDCTDKADNKADTSEKHKFTIDKTVPVIDVSYSNGQVAADDYYNKAVTATITINEHNFDAGKADIKIGGQDGASIAASGFHDNGDTHTASVVFDRDGEYSLEVSYTDEAGNEADAYTGNTFNIDLENPEIVINNVKDKSANKDDVNPVITCTDKNYDGNQVSITVRGANSGEISLDTLNLERRAVANGEEFALIFPKDEAMDDVYTLTAEMVDKAGNETEESIQFSVNRYGSVYTLGTETGEWLTNGVCSYIKEGKPVVIIETNVDEVVEHNISYTSGAINSETVAVKELADCSGEERTDGTYFETKEIGYDDDWYQYQHTIAAANFTKEGKYSIQIDSKDKAGNHASNVSNKHSDSNLEMIFAVDQTAPSAVISGTENGKVYKEAKRTVLIDVQDNLALNTVTVYLNNKEYATYDAKEIAELEDGFIPVEVTDSFSTQTIQVKATDMAGNILSEDADGEYDAVFEDFNLIVTQNVFVQMLHTYWILIILALVAIGAIIAVVIVKRKKKA